MASSEMTKAELREQFSATRRARSAADLAAARARVCEHVVELVDTLAVTCVAAYVPLRTEPGSVELLTALAARTAQILVPYTRPDRDLDWQAWPTTEASALLGVDALRSAGLIVVPALAVARDGTRLGRGGGSYDRALLRRRADVQVWALLFDGELVDDLPSAAWDVAVHGVITPAGRTRLRRNTADPGNG